MFSKTNKTKKSFIGAIAMSLVLLMGSAFGFLLESNLGQITKSTTGVWTDYATTVSPMGDCFYIVNANQLAYLAKNPSIISGKHIRLMADIDLAGHEWVPINGQGTSQSVATDFDGNEHTISNMTINQPATANVGFFGSYSYVNIKNVNFSNVNVVGNTDIGVVIGNGVGGSNITNVNVTSGKVISKGGMVGGIAARVLGTIKDCTNNAEVISYGNITGGLAYIAIRVENCINTGDVIGTSQVGGLVGMASLTTVVNSYAECNITAESIVGGIAPTFTRMTGTVTIENSGYKGRITVLGENPEDIGVFVGGNDNYNSTSGKLAIKNSFALAEVVLKNTTSKDSIKNCGAEATDSVSYTSSYCYTDVITSGGETKLKRYKVGVSETEPFKDMVYHANINGGYPFPKSLFAVGQFIECDTLSYLKEYRFIPVDITTNGTNYYVELGQYPQTYVGDSMNTTLENWYSGKSSEKIYMVDNGTSDVSNMYYAYKYTDGNTYVRVPSAIVFTSGYTFQDGTTVVAGGIYWFKVEPIKWRILNYTDYQNGTAPIVLAERGLTANVPWSKTSSSSNNWSNSNIRTWLNGRFYSDAFDKLSQKHIAVSNSGETMSDNVWLLSYGETGCFSSDVEKISSPTDFAIVNNSLLMTNKNYTTEFRPNGGTCYWWLRSSYSSNQPHSVFYNGSYGGMTETTCYPAVRPAMTLNI